MSNNSMYSFLDSEQQFDEVPLYNDVMLHSTSKPPESMLVSPIPAPEKPKPLRSNADPALNREVVIKMELSPEQLELQFTMPQLSKPSSPSDISSSQSSTEVHTTHFICQKQGEVTLCRKPGPPLYPPLPISPTLIFSSSC